MTALWIIIAIVALLVIWAIAAYNRFITFKNRADEALADIDVQLKRRYDLIPNLVNTVKGYASHESGTLEAVIAARNSAMQSGTATTLAEKGVAENQLSGALKSIFALSENYPDLKANQNFLSLQTELSDTENKIQAARRFYNSNVRDYNTMLTRFPSNIIANMFHFVSKDFFQLGADDAAKNPVEVKF
ncbi:MAG: LemA family protein LemA protein [Patescibacteria group bacterium]|nr:LemA family protein LemA protein [Patescibacteria group bacterium]